MQPDDINSEDIHHLDDDLPCDSDSNFRPVIPVLRESNEPIVEWTDNDILLRGAFPDLPGETVGYPAQPRLIRPSVSPSVISLLIILQKIAPAQQIRSISM